MALATIPPMPTSKIKERRLYLYTRPNGDLECWAGSKYQAWVLMLAHGFKVDIEKIVDMGNDIRVAG